MNFFDQFGNGVNKVEKRFLGEDYNYAKNILSPTQINMLQFTGKDFNLISNNGLDALAANFAGLINYVELLVSGTSVAATTGKPLGNRFFLPTAGTCRDNSNNIQTWLDIFIYCIRRFISYDDVVEEAVEEVNIMVRNMS